MYVKHVRGRGGEALAAGYLELIGLTVVARNTRLAGVEVDLVALDGETHVLVEVKLRSRSDYGGPAQAVDARKRGRLLRAARTLGEVPVRVDLIAIELVDGGLGLRHYRNAFTE
jgi:putative endonuclease